MKRMIVITMLLCFCTCASGAAKSTRPQPSSTGVAIASVFYFFIEGDGITTSLTFNPRRVPPVYLNAVGNLPKLPLVGVDNNGARCLGSDNEPITGAVSKGMLTVNFTTAAPANEFQECSITLLFQPE
jgi:hypothetical protein